MNASSEIVREVFSQVLEKQVFMFAEELATAEFPFDKGEWIETRIGFQGPFFGLVSLALPKGAELEMAANFLGKDVDDPDVSACAEDAIKEIINVVCGHLLTKMAGDELVFDLSVPMISALSQEELKAICSESGAYGFDVEGNPVLLRFTCSESKG